MTLNINKLSYSNIALWNFCPRAWILRYHYGIRTPSSSAQVFGTVIHRVIQKSLLEKTKLKHQIDQLQKEIYKAMRENKLPCNINEITELIYMGNKILKDPMTSEILETINISSESQIEHKFEFRVPGVRVPIIGYIDIIDDNGVPYDIKTSKWDWSYDKAIKELQPDFYLTGLDYENRKSPNDQFTYIIVMKTEEPSSYFIDTNRPNYKERTYEIIKNTWKGIKNREWELDQEKPACRTCDLKKECHLVKSWFDI